MAKSKVNIEPINDKVLVKPLEEEEVTAGGIVLPDTAKEKPKQGTVEATGPGRLLDDGNRAEMKVKVGDKVIYASYAGTEIKLGTDEYLIMSEDDILAVIED